MLSNLALYGETTPLSMRRRPRSSTFARLESTATVNVWTASVIGG